MKNNRFSPKKRHKARQFVLQALYQWQLTGNDVGEIILTFCVEINANKTDVDYFVELMRNIPVRITELDQTMTPFLDRPQNELGPVELAILRIATYELLYCAEIPYKVIINEAIELGKTFGPEDSFKFINSVLDKVAVQSRSVEFKSNQ